MNNAYLAKAKSIIEDPQVLSIVAAKRARQLATGARPMIKCDAANLLDVALLEIGEGLLSYEFGDGTEPEVTAAAPAEEEAKPAEESPAQE